MRTIPSPGYKISAALAAGGEINTAQRTAARMRVRRWPSPRPELVARGIAAWRVNSAEVVRIIVNCACLQTRPAPTLRAAAIAFGNLATHVLRVQSLGNRANAGSPCNCRRPIRVLANLTIALAHSDDHPPTKELIPRGRPRNVSI
jgi:hypothetical protein